MPKTYKISAEKAIEIEEIRKTITDKKVDRRLHAVQLRGEGLTNHEIAEKLGRVDTKPNNASFRQNFTHPALKSLDRRQPACDFLPCLRKIYARKSAYYLSVNTP